MSKIQSVIESLASQFASSVLDAIRGMSLDELALVSGGVPTNNTARPSKSRNKGRLPRRSLEDIGEVVEKITTLLANEPNGLRAEDIRQVLKLDVREIARPIAEALAAKKITKTGKKRATVYHAAGKAKKVAAKKPVKAKAKAKAKPAAKKKPVARKPAKTKSAKAKPAAAVNGAAATTTADA